MNIISSRLAVLSCAALASLSLQGCLLFAAGAGGAGGYEAKKHDCSVQAPVKKDGAGGVTGQAPVKCRD